VAAALAVCEKRIQNVALAAVERPLEMHVVHEACGDLLDRADALAEALAKLCEAERSLGRRTGQLQHRHEFGAGRSSAWLGRYDTAAIRPRSSRSPNLALRSRNVRCGRRARPRPRPRRPLACCSAR